MKAFFDNRRFGDVDFDSEALCFDTVVDRNSRTCLVEEIFHLINCIPGLDASLVICLRRLIARFLSENKD